MWAGIIGDRLVGPHVLVNRLTGQAYTNFLENTISYVLEDTPLINRQYIHFLHDGAPAHFSRTARRYLDRRFPDRWIGRGGPIAWPPRSRDLNPLDFYLWGHLKSFVYSSPVPDLESLRNRIVACSEDIRNTTGVWDRVRRSMRHRCESAVKNLKLRIYKTVISPVVLYGCETWTLILRDEQRLRVSENKVLKKIFGAKRDEVTGEWRKLYKAELHALYSSPDVIRIIKSRRLRWAGHVARKGESRYAYKVLAGRSEGKRSSGRPRRRWEDNIKMDLRKMGYDDRVWINLAQDRDRWRAYVRAAMNLRNRPAQGLRPSSRLTALERNADIGCALYKDGLEEGVLSYKIQEDQKRRRAMTEQRNITGRKNARQSADYERHKRQQNVNRSLSKELLPEVDVK
ncbi:hypothetical protein ANN_11042 [Periplaneta americana]|uniref:Uncharacterized protein n=1 Tax=Periplaneta americana TaxID=6978 RepID=A0ABQ8T3W8_PERAM|nr:hypothetical protein ANN_11042 [Periplaneta americana]